MVFAGTMPTAALVATATLMLAVTPGSAQEAGAGPKAVTEDTMEISVTIDRGTDLGQCFGSLYEAKTADNSFAIGAGFPNAYNTRYRADRHAVQLFVRPTDGKRKFDAEPLPRPNRLCGAYLYGREDVVYSTYDGNKTWDSGARSWPPADSVGGTDETMRVGNSVLTFGNSTVLLNGKTILPPPDRGSYQLFFYANGHLCFYHVDRGKGGYRPYENDGNGSSKLYACPWTPDDGQVDPTKAIVLTLPVVGETTFAWGQFGNQIVTGSNIGGFYVFEDGRWTMLRKPVLGVSFQLYSTMMFRDRLIMGQYPTGRLFEYDGKALVDLPGWPPCLDGVSRSSREAQTTVIYGGDLFVGVWPWGELWRYNPDSKAWAFASRMFKHPDLSDQITHPYDVETAEAKGKVSNQWGQRVTSLITSGPHLFVSTSAKWPCPWDAKAFPFLSPDLWESYGTVHRASMSGHLGAPTKWTDGPTELTFTLSGSDITIKQDGTLLAHTALSVPLADRLKAAGGLKDIRWGTGIYGRFGGRRIQGSVRRR
jgi:hypothetical protein